MITLALRTSDATCRVYIDGKESSWEAGRGLARGLLGYLEGCLRAHGVGFTDIGGLVVYRGPGSFTGLRIGITVMNTIAGAQGIPIIGTTGEEWLGDGRARLERGEDDRIVLPEYGGGAHITPPRK